MWYLAIKSAHGKAGILQEAYARQTRDARAVFHPVTNLIPKRFNERTFPKRGAKEFQSFLCRNCIDQYCCKVFLIYFTFALDVSLVPRVLLSSVCRSRLIGICINRFSNSITFLSSFQRECHLLNLSVSPRSGHVFGSDSWPWLRPTS